MSQENLVSVCIPVYNADKTIEATLSSLFSQKGGRFEIIAADNCSSDNTKTILKKYALSHQIKIFEHEKNCGGEENFEFCLSLGSCPYTAIYHADDVYEDTILQKESGFLDDMPECAVVLTRANFIDEAGRFLKTSKTFKKLKIQDKDYVLFDALSLLKKLVRYGNFLITPSAMFRTDVAKNKIKYWDAKNFGTSADLDVWLRAAELGKLGLLEEPLINYRLSRSQGGYKYNKARVEKSDFLRVLEYWLDKENIKPKIDSKDLFYFEGLKKIDRLLSGVRAHLKNEETIGNELLKNSFHLSYFKLFRAKYLMFWFLSLGLRLKVSAGFIKPLLKKILYKNYLG